MKGKEKVSGQYLQLLLSWYSQKAKKSLRNLQEKILQKRLELSRFELEEQKELLLQGKAKRRPQ